MDPSIVSPLLEESEAAENEILRTLSKDGLVNEVEEFADSYGLSHKIEVLRRALYLLQGEALEEIPGITEHELAALRRETSHKWQQPRLLYFTIAICSLGAVEQGWAQTGMNGANLYFPVALGIGSNTARDVFIVGLINSAIYLSISFWGAWLSEPINNKLGRRGAIFVGTVLCLSGNLGSSFSWSWFSLLLFRLILGTGLGINASTVSVYAAECAPSTIRGGLAVSWQMWVAFGIFLGFMANLACYNYGAGAWRLQLAAPFLPAIPLIFTVYACPESPAWYMKAGRYGLAYQSFTRLRNTELQGARELYASYLQHQAKFRASSTSSSYFSRLMNLIRVTRLRNAAVAAYTVMLAQQLCGINIISFYSSTIFSDSGFSKFGALVASCIFGFVNFVGAFPAIWTMDALGRRSLLLWTLPFMALTMLGAGLAFRLPKGNVQFGLLASLIYLFCAEYSPGMGPVPAAYSAEVFPLSHREVGMSMAVATANFWATVLSVTFPGLLTGLGSEGAFELYASLNVLAFGLVFLFVRETKRKTLDELDEVFAVKMSVFLKSLVSEHLPCFSSRQVLRKRGHIGTSVSRDSSPDRSPL